MSDQADRPDAPSPLSEHDKREIQLQEANKDMVEETRKLRRQLIAAGLEPCV